MQNKNNRNLVVFDIPLFSFSMMFWTWFATKMEEGRIKNTGRNWTKQIYTHKHKVKNYNWTTVWKTTYFNLGKNTTTPKNITTKKKN